MGSRAVVMPFTDYAQTVKWMVSEIRYLKHGWEYIRRGILDGAGHLNVLRAKRAAEILIELDWPRAYLGSTEELSTTTDLIEWAMSL